MPKIHIEVCMISARGLPRSSSLWKLQWFAVGWIDPKSKFCSKIDNSGGSAPVWRTKFSMAVDDDKADVKGLLLTVEVRSRETIFFREKLHGSASIPLAEFVEQFEKRRSSGVEEASSFQLRGRRSGEARGFVDVSIRIWEGVGNDPPLLPLREEWRKQHHQEKVLPPSPPTSILRRGRKSVRDNASPQPYHPNYVHSHPENWEDGYERRPTPPPPPPPSNTGFIPSLFPSSYIGVPTNAGDVAMGAGVGALAAGAVLFGDDFMGSSFGFGGGGSLHLTHDPIEYIEH